MVAPETGHNGHHSTGSAGDRAGHRPEMPPHPLDPVMRRLAEMREYVTDYLEARGDAFKLRARQTALRAALGFVALVGLIAAVASATVLVLSGTAGGIAAALGGRLWAGQLITGLTLFLILGLVTWLGIRRINETSRRGTIDKYERKHLEQRARVGQDVRQRSAE
jgi:hypothetical protein